MEKTARRRAAKRSSLEELALLDYALPVDLARVLGIPPQTIDRWIKSKRLTPIEWHSQKVYLLSEARSLRESPPKRGRPGKKAEG